MNARRWLPLLLVALVAAAPQLRTSDPEALLRAADDAYRANQLDRAAELYERAGVRTTEPSRVAFNVAATKYRQNSLADAEIGYRSCLEKNDPYRARALFGLGNCLLRRAESSAALDRVTLRSAIDRFTACLADPGCDPALASDARHNRARARLLLLQTPPPPGASDESNSEEDPREDRDKPDDPQGKDDPGGRDPGRGDRKGVESTPANGGAEDRSETGDTKTGPGRGTLLPPPKDADAPPLPPGDAAEHIERAARRILEDLAAYRRSRARPAAPGVRDW